MASTQHLQWNIGMSTMIVAIDGPAGAGKSTLARRVAAKLGAVYIDTGAMYRAVAVAALRSNRRLDDAARLEALARHADIRFEPGSSRVLLDGEDVSEAIRKPEISQASSRVSPFRACGVLWWESSGKWGSPRAS